MNFALQLKIETTGAVNSNFCKQLIDFRLDLAAQSERLKRQRMNHVPSSRIPVKYTRLINNSIRQRVAFNYSLAVGGNPHADNSFRTQKKKKKLNKSTLNVLKISFRMKCAIH